MITALHALLYSEDPPTTKGAEFSGEPVDYGYGLMINLRIPAAGEVQLYEPKYPPSYNL